MHSMDKDGGGGGGYTWALLACLHGVFRSTAVRRHRRDDDEMWKEWYGSVRGSIGDGGNSDKLAGGIDADNFKRGLFRKTAVSRVEGAGEDKGEWEKTTRSCVDGLNIKSPDTP